eukprot:3780943-Rhodomonas_salina.1
MSLDVLHACVTACVLGGVHPRAASDARAWVGAGGLARACDRAGAAGPGRPRDAGGLARGPAAVPRWGQARAALRAQRPRSPVSRRIRGADGRERRRGRRELRVRGRSGRG